MNNILYIHQSADLYGSDKVLRDVILGVDKKIYNPIVILPRVGLLYDALIAKEIEVHIVNLAIISRAKMNFYGLASILINLVVSIFEINKIVRGRKISIVHSNTLVVLSGALWSFFYRKSFHVWHIHEIVHDSPIIKKILALIVNLFSDKVICDSKAVMDSLSSGSKLLQNKSVVIWNGYEKKSNIEFNFNHLKSDKIVVLLVGRFNRMKGQLFILSCIKKLPSEIRSLFLFRFVGSAPIGQEYYLDNFMMKVNELNITESVELHGFTEDVEMHWISADIAIVPSIEPEAFGLVAIEAMAHNLPVIASRIGGLNEIVLNGTTGYLFEPHNEVEFCEALVKLIDPAFREKVGIESFYRYKNYFTMDIYLSKIQQIYSEHII